MTAVSFDISISLDGDIAALTTALLAAASLRRARTGPPPEREPATDPDAAVEAAASTPA